VGLGIRWGIIGATVTLLSSVGVAQNGASQAPLPLDQIVQSMEKAQSAVRPQVSYQIIREYRLFGAQDSKANSEVVAEVNFRPPAFKDYRIQRSSGSSRGQQLVRRVLDHEVEANSNKASSAITRDNYNFKYLGDVTIDGHSCYLLGLEPKHSFLLRQVEGEAEKTPSWWLKQVRVKLVFTDLDGIWVQTNMEATADVRLVGTHTLTSHLLDYRRQDEVAETPIRSISTIRKR
jgi:hypothetical protein